MLALNPQEVRPLRDPGPTVVPALYVVNIQPLVFYCSGGGVGGGVIQSTVDLSDIIIHVAAALTALTSLSPLVVLLMYREKMSVSPSPAHRQPIMALAQQGGVRCHSC